MFCSCSESNSCIINIPILTISSRCYFNLSLPALSSLSFTNSEVDKVQNTPIPDFHRLVNYPDYLNKSRPNSNDAPGSNNPNNGKRHCVMCGKLRVCSASSASLGTSALRRTKKPEEVIDPLNNNQDNSDPEDTHHIIPRQNKGLCTACDVTVWVFTETNLEIKWCKGCKNFRPWAAFGDKGLATKCLRCRSRQREKYALQKDELRLRRMRQQNKAPSASSKSSTTEEEKKEENEENERHEMDAAKGLRDLMAAAV